MDDRYKGYDNYGSYYQDQINQERSIYTFEDDRYELDINECILLQNYEIQRNQNHNHSTHLILTNQRVILLEKQNVGLFKKITIQSVYPLSQIKIFNQQPMVHITRNREDEKVVQIQLLDGSIETYHSDDHNTRFINHMVSNIYQALGYEVPPQNDLFAKLKQNFNDSPELQDMFDSVGELVNDLSSNLFGVEILKKTTSTKQSPFTKQQVEQLKSLKALLDAGILTQEEFDEKKRKVLAE